MKKMFNEGNPIHNFMSSSGSGTVINYGSSSDFFPSYGSSSGSGSTSQKVTVPVPVPQHWIKAIHEANLHNNWNEYSYIFVSKKLLMSIN
jgi:hypothetical protein